ncbi:hypothetical protein C8Q79DRAFT_1007319 [Trametes meyenii]|nr:hypothetical protein C8Q79DRAFT_1007319 [Trametes meyenii]
MLSGAPLGAIECDPAKSKACYPLPVLFIHGSLALLGGSTIGEISVWDVLDTVTGGPQLNVPEAEEAQAQVLHTLPIPKRAKALAIDAFYDNQHDEFFIAAGVMNESSASTCVLWKAVEYATDGGGDTGTQMRWPHWRNSRKVAGVVSLFVLACAIVLALGSGIAREGSASPAESS